ncbi:MAG TPA: hypothetical protein PKW35_05575 [Nannocystaceae bacterium]|nr:hypothetical protein [Nannocystaceae bacterium]
MDVAQDEFLVLALISVLFDAINCWGIPLRFLDAEHNERSLIARRVRHRKDILEECPLVVLSLEGVCDLLEIKRRALFPCKEAMEEIVDVLACHVSCSQRT